MINFYEKEELISTVLGAIIIVIVGILVVNYFRSQRENGKVMSEEEYCQFYSKATLKDTPNECLKYFLKEGEEGCEKEN